MTAYYVKKESSRDYSTLKNEKSNLLYEIRLLTHVMTNHSLGFLCAQKSTIFICSNKKHVTIATTFSSNIQIATLEFCIYKDEK